MNNETDNGAETMNNETDFFKVGAKVQCNGYPGTIVEVYDGELLGSVVVRLDSGTTVASISELRRFLTTVRYSVVETAKLVRKALKSNFPGVKFSVRSESYSGGATITIEYATGPDAKDVDNVIDEFKGANFDGMTDSMNYNSHLELRDGEITRIRYGADFIMVQKDRYAG